MGESTATTLSNKSGACDRIDEGAKRCLDRGWGEATAKALYSMVQ